MGRNTAHLPVHETLPISFFVPQGGGGGADLLALLTSALESFWPPRGSELGGGLMLPSSPIPSPLNPCRVGAGGTEFASRPWAPILVGSLKPVTSGRLSPEISGRLLELSPEMRGRGRLERPTSVRGSSPGEPPTTSSFTPAGS